MNKSDLTVLIVGPGDVARHLASGLVREPAVGRVVLAGRSDAGRDFAALLAACAQIPVEFFRCDAMRGEELAKLIEQLEPALIVQSAALLSPWFIGGRPEDPACAAIRRGGFGLQLPAQLPAVMSLMGAVRQVGYRGPVVNCSYPDATHAMLAPLGLAPTVGVGNVAMIEARIRALLRARGPRRVAKVDVLAHHGQFYGAMQAVRPAGGAPVPRVYVGPRQERRDELTYECPALPLGRDLNILTAATALPVLRALLPGGGALETSTAGPLGMAGGYPVRIARGRITLRLPRDVTAASAKRFMTQAGRLDGIDHIASDGTAYFTQAAQDAVKGIDPALAAPLHPTEAMERFGLLRRVVGA